MVPAQLAVLPAESAAVQLYCALRLPSTKLTGVQVTARAADEHLSVAVMSAETSASAPQGVVAALGQESTGAALSSTVTLKLQEATAPHSVAVQVTVVSPKPKLVPD